MNYKNISVVICVLLSSQTFAKSKYPLRNSSQSCSNISLLNTSRTADIFKSPRNQGPIGWCYAYAAADLMSAKLDTELSAFHIALLFNKGVGGNILLDNIFKLGRLFSKKNSQVYEGGWTDRNLKYLKKFETVCTEDALTSNLNLGNNIQYLLENTKKIKDESVFLSDDDNTTSYMFFRANVSSFKTFFPYISANNFIDTIRDNDDKSINAILLDVAQLSCEDKMIDIPQDLDIISRKIPSLFRVRKIGKKRKKIKSLKRFHSFVKDLDNVLDNVQPFAIHYDVGTLLTRNKKGFLHASSVIGRKFENGSCQYQIRNSWGKVCSRYNEEKVTSCDKESGYYWIKEETLFDVASEFIYLK